MTELAPALAAPTIELALLLSDFVSIALAFVIAAVAYRGYTRNDSRPMLYIAVGFVMTFGIPGGIFVLSLVVPIPSVVVGTITQVGEIGGMVTILYGFWAPVRSTVGG